MVTVHLYLEGVHYLEFKYLDLLMDCQEITPQGKNAGSGNPATRMTGNSDRTTCRGGGPGLPISVPALNNVTAQKVFVRTAL